MIRLLVAPRFNYIDVLTIVIGAELIRRGDWLWVPVIAVAAVLLQVILIAWVMRK